MTQAVEALEGRARAEPGEGLVEPVAHAVILQPGLHQRGGFLLADAGLQFAGDGLRAAVGQLLHVAEFGQVLGGEGGGWHARSPVSGLLHRSMSRSFLNRKSALGQTSEMAAAAAVTALPGRRNARSRAAGLDFQRCREKAPRASPAIGWAGRGAVVGLRRAGL
ncbi:hypothetical protein D3C72_1725760 [compost metagenome]